MRHLPVCVEAAHDMRAEIILQYVGNLIVIGVLPFRLGQMGSPFWYLLTYAVVTGLILTVAEDLRFARALFQRADVRSYAQVRVALIAVVGTAPFVAGMTLAV
jgi:hypothetical protein